MNIKKLINQFAYLKRLFHKPNLIEELEKIEGVISVDCHSDPRFIIIDCEKDVDVYKIIKIAKIFYAQKYATLTSPDSNTIKYLLKWKTKVK